MIVVFACRIIDFGRGFCLIVIMLVCMCFACMQAFINIVIFIASCYGFSHLKSEGQILLLSFKSPTLIAKVVVYKILAIQSNRMRQEIFHTIGRVSSSLFVRAPFLS